MVLDYLCGDPLDERKSVNSQDTSECSSEEAILECDYDSQVTKLYHNIEERKWEEVLYFLDTGKWYNDSFFSIFGEQGESPQIQARTWVTALDDHGSVRWCQLPLHAAVTFLAPFAVIQKLVEIYPKSVRCADDQDMLPLHYAFRFGAEDDVLVHLLEKFPQAIGKKAVKDRLPLDLAQFGPRADRGTLVDYYMQSAVKLAKTEWDREYERMVASMKNESDSTLIHELELKETKLREALEELEKARSEIVDLQNQLNGSLMPSRSMRSNKSSRSKSRSKSRTHHAPPTSKIHTNSKKSLKEEDLNSTHQPRGRSRKPKKRTTLKKAEEEPVRKVFGQIFSVRKK